MSTSQKSRAVAAAPASDATGRLEQRGAIEARRSGVGPPVEARRVRGDRGPASAGHRAAADQQPGRPGRRRLPRAEQRPDADPQLRQAGPAQPRPGVSRAGADPDRRGGAAGGDDHPGHARPVAAGREPRPPRADRDGPAGARGRRPGREGHGQAPRPAGREARRRALGAGPPRADPAGAAQPADQRAPGDAGGGDGAGPPRPGRRRPPGRAERRRHRRRDRAGRPAADLRAVLLDQDLAGRRGAGGHGPGPGRLPRHRRGPPRPPPRREPAGTGLDVHPDPPRLPARRAAAETQGAA